MHRNIISLAILQEPDDFSGYIFMMPRMTTNAIYIKLTALL